jgi:hypothetical protein
MTSQRATDSNRELGIFRLSYGRKTRHIEM